MITLTKQCECGRTAEFVENVYSNCYGYGVDGGTLVGYRYSCYDCAPRYAKSLVDGRLRGIGEENMDGGSHMPDIMNKAQYQQYEADVAQFIEEEGIRFLRTGTDTKSEDEGGSPDPWFSWRPCECCGCTLGGNREYLFAVDADGEQVQYEICEDCVYYVNYGRLDDQPMMRVEENHGQAPDVVPVVAQRNI